MAYYADVNGQFMATLMEVATQKHWNIHLPWEQLKEEIKEVILYGADDTIWDVTWEFNTKSRSGTQSLRAKWLGLCHYINDEFQRKRHNKNIKNLEELLHDVVCPTCQGSRLKPELLNTKFLRATINELSQMSIASCLELLETLDNKSEIEVDEVVLAISKRVLPAVKASLKTMVDLGLSYLNLDRAIRTLSGGERQRVTLAGQLSTHLFGVTYVLDEPTLGLDESQVSVLSKVLKRIVENGNTVVVVEHDLSFIQEADYLIEMGPGAGRLGGEVIYQGTIEGIDNAKHSVTYKLMHDQGVARNKDRNSQGNSFGLKGAFANNLKGIDVNFYSGQIIAIKGVSGSGKSSLIKEVLYRSWKKNRPVQCESIHGFDQFEEVLLIDQELLKQNRLSTPVSYTGMIEEIKGLFSKTEFAKSKGLKKADFSYQSKHGKCATCAGHGKLKTSMDFMSDIWLTCDVCKGMRYNDAILQCKLNDHSIGEVLQMTVQETKDFFGMGRIAESLDILQRVGVGHVVLGQAGNALSGGEAQRLKLAKSMMQKRKGTSLYLFDEPSTGLHYFDILEIIKVFQSIVDRGDTVLFIEHNSTLIESANQVITLGPESGECGGEIIQV